MSEIKNKVPTAGESFTARSTYVDVSGMGSGNWSSWLTFAVREDGSAVTSRGGVLPAQRVADLFVEGRTWMGDSALTQPSPC